MRGFTLILLTVLCFTNASAQDLYKGEAEEDLEGQFRFTPLSYEEHLAEVEGYIEKWHKGVRPRFRDKALEHAPLIVEECLAYEDYGYMDPLLVASIIAKEANFDAKAIGKRGEVGLMQTWCKANNGFDVSKPSGQLGAGVKRLHAAFQACGTLEGALHHYASGECFLKSYRVKANKRIRRYQDAVAEFRLSPSSNMGEVNDG